MDFGYTNSDKEFNQVVAFKDAAIADEWKAEPMYGGHESIDRACHLERDGFKMSILTRKDVGKWKFEAKVYIWGPDRLAINPPKEYDFGVITKGVDTCMYCRKETKVFQVGFAGRACEECLPEQKKLQEYPGWTR